MVNAVTSSISFHCRGGSADIAQFLLDHGADVNANIFGSDVQAKHLSFTPLHCISDLLPFFLFILSQMLRCQGLKKLFSCFVLAAPVSRPKRSMASHRFIAQFIVVMQQLFAKLCHVVRMWWLKHMVRRHLFIFLPIHVILLRPFAVWFDCYGESFFLQAKYCWQVVQMLMRPW